MENEKRFDLEQSLNQWRSTLENSPAIRQSDMEELEAHLRDSIQTLQSKGLGAEEAFLIACRRLGPSRELDREYGKANQRQVWLDRALWLAVGLMLYLWIRAIASTITMDVFACFPNWSIGLPWAGCFYAASCLMVQVAGWLFLLRLVTRYSMAATGWVQYCFRNPQLPLMGILALSLNLATILSWFIPLTKMKLSGDSMDIAIINSRNAWYLHTSNLGYIIAFVYLVYRYIRSLGETSPEPATAASEPLSSSSEVLALQNMGLSKPEVTFLVQQRQDKDSAVFQMDFACVRRIWMERLMWMIAAVVLYTCFVSPMQFAVNLVTLQIPSWLLHSGHLLGAIAVLIQSVLFLSLAAIAWRVTTRPINAIPWFAGILVKWPLAGALGLLCLTIGGYWCFFICLKHFSVAFHSDQGEAVWAFWAWQRYGNQFWLGVLPGLLVFWLGRQRLNLTVKELFEFRRN